MTAPDPRLSDDRVKAARRAEWFRGFIAEDPNPEYSAWDARDGLAGRIVPLPTDLLLDPVRVDSLRVPGPVVPRESHSMYKPLVMFGMILSGFTIVFLILAAGWAIGRWSA